VAHADGRRSSLTGLAVVLIEAGDVVHRGQVIGIAAPGLHLGVREGDRYVDPARLFAVAVRHAWLVPLN
jgi:murein DD-endopeptidase MepM/ murein hydrolase activator NlpD